MPAGTIAGDRIRAVAGLAPTPRVPSRPGCHRQASPRREPGLCSWRQLARRWSASPVAAAYPFGGRGAAGLPPPGLATARHPKRAGRRLLFAGPPPKAPRGISQRSR